jgi:type II secretory pathway component PulK
VLDELLLVKGITPEVFEKIKEYVTIYGNGKVNINTASVAALLAIGLDQKLANKVVSFRSGVDGVWGTSDDNVFEDVGDIIPDLDNFFKLSEMEKAQLEYVAESFSVKSNEFLIRSLGSFEKKGRRLEIDCVVDTAGRVLSWRES